jgi:hypothetical protein
MTGWKAAAGLTIRAAFAVALSWPTRHMQDAMTKASEPQFIESTAGEVAAELARRGIAPQQRVTIAIAPNEPADWVAKARQFSRPRVIEAGWSDDDIDQLIKQAQKEVEPGLG